jgi:citrate lyase subunit beta/citryl-CoA lyase
MSSYRSKIPVAPLMVSGDNEKHLSKIPKLETDSIILNLEDGVGDKRLALKNVKSFLEKECQKMVIVRVNALDEGGLSEIEELSPLSPDAIRIPKIRSREDVLKIGGEFDIHLSIETKEAYLNLQNLKTPRVKAFYLGILDLYADLKLNQKSILPKNPTAVQILTNFFIVSKALEVTPISFVFQDYKNETLFREWLELEKEIGFQSKGALSPTQAKLIRETFQISELDIEKAKEIVKLFEENSKKGVHGFSNEKYGFIDEPIYKGALAIL